MQITSEEKTGGKDNNLRDEYSGMKRIKHRNKPWGGWENVKQKQ